MTILSTAGVETLLRRMGGRLRHSTSATIRAWVNWPTTRFGTAVMQVRILPP